MVSTLKDTSLKWKRDVSFTTFIFCTSSRDGDGLPQHIALKLKEKGYEVTVIDNLLEQIHGIAPEKTSPLYCSIKDKVRFIKGDVCDKALLEQALEDVDYVIHLAAETGTGQSM